MVITMVTHAQAVTSIAVDLGMLESLPAGAVWDQMSTIGVEGTATINSIVERRRPDVLFLDVPVSEARSPPSKGSSHFLPPGPSRHDRRPSPSSQRSGNELFPGWERSGRAPE